MSAKASEKQKPLFSVVIPSYNYAGTLPRAINSVLSQSGDDFDLLVIDDGSTDDTADVVGKVFGEDNVSFRFIQRENSGLAATRNFGVDETEGRYLIFLDADDEMSPNALNHYRHALGNQYSIGMLAGGHTSKSPSGKVNEHAIALLPSQTEDRLRAYLLDKSLAFSNGAVAISREVFSGYRYPEQFRASEDIPMFAFILANFPVVTLSESLAIIYKHDDSLRHNVTHASAAGLLIVDEVFDPQRIPSRLQGLKIEFLAQRSLSLFRTLFIAGQRGEARAYYHKAIRTKPAAIFRLSYFIKYIRSWF